MEVREVAVKLSSKMIYLQDLPLDKMGSEENIEKEVSSKKSKTDQTKKEKKQ